MKNYRPFVFIMVLLSFIFLLYVALMRLLPMVIALTGPSILVLLLIAGVILWGFARLFTWAFRRKT